MRIYSDEIEFIKSVSKPHLEGMRLKVYGNDCFLLPLKNEIYPKQERLFGGTGKSTIIFFVEVFNLFCVIAFKRAERIY